MLLLIIILVLLFGGGGGYYGYSGGEPAEVSASSVPYSLSCCCCIYSADCAFNPPSIPKPIQGRPVGAPLFIYNIQLETPFPFPLSSSRRALAVFEALVWSA